MIPKKAVRSMGGHGWQMPIELATLRLSDTDVQSRIAFLGIMLPTPARAFGNLIERRATKLQNRMGKIIFT